MKNSYDPRWLNSLCVGKYLHDFRISTTTLDGVVEICPKCRSRRFFKHNVPNREYLSYHMRSALQKRDKRFKIEYAG